jgi:hypothetical protein
MKGTTSSGMEKLKKCSYTDPLGIFPQDHFCKCHLSTCFD